MATVIQAQVGAARSNDGDFVMPALGRDRDMLVSQLHGRYYQNAKRGNMWVLSTPAAGVTVPIHTNTTAQFVIYNPASSGYDVSVLVVVVGYVSGTMVAGHMVYSFVKGLTTAPTTTTNALIQNARLDSGASMPGGVSAYSPATLAAAATYLRPMGNSQVVQAATATNAPWSQIDNVDGSIVLGPGTLLNISGNAAAFVVAAIAAVVEFVPVGSN